jgi:hypothetical protein
VGFVVNKVALRQVFSHSVSLANSHSTYCCTVIIVLSFGAGTVGEIVAVHVVPLSPHLFNVKKIKKKKRKGDVGTSIHTYLIM